MLAFRRRSVLVLVLLVTGCADQPRNASDHGAATTATHAQGAKASFPGPSQARSAVVTHISDGDTITLSGIGKTRLIGIDTPETYGQGECYGRAASRFTKRVLKPGTRVEYPHLFVAAARRARKAARGLWSPSTCSGKNGGDQDCADFRTQAEAQRYF